MEKKYRLAAEQIVRLIKPMGGCVASDRITVDGARVGSMVRKPPDRSRDSGWQFFAGDETEAHFADADAHAIFDVNTICNYDRDVIPFLYALPGAVFERDKETGDLVEAEDSRPDPDESDTPEGVQVVSGLFPVGHGWSIFLPTPFRQRVDGRLVLWRQGVTLFIEAHDTGGATLAAREAAFSASIPASAFGTTREARDGLVLLSFRYRPDETGAMAPIYVAVVIGATGSVEVSCYFDREEDLPAVIGITRTIRPVGLA
ncbi:MAG: DUF2185 domain-containing protein [Polyangia bacterium]